MHARGRRLRTRTRTGRFDKETITKAMRETFQRDGYLVMPSVFDSDEVRSMAAERRTLYWSSSLILRCAMTVKAAGAIYGGTRQSG